MQKLSIRFAKLNDSVKTILLHQTRVSSADVYIILLPFCVKHRFQNQINIAIIIDYQKLNELMSSRSAIIDPTVTGGIFFSCKITGCY